MDTQKILDSEKLFHLGTILGSTVIFIIAMIVVEQLGDGMTRAGLAFSVVLFVVLVSGSGYLIAQKTYENSVEEEEMSDPSPDSSGP